MDGRRRSEGNGPYDESSRGGRYRDRKSEGGSGRGSGDNNSNTRGFHSNNNRYGPNPGGGGFDSNPRAFPPPPPQQFVVGHKRRFEDDFAAGGQARNIHYHHNPQQQQQQFGHLGGGGGGGVMQAHVNSSSNMMLLQLKSAVLTLGDRDVLPQEDKTYLVPPTIAASKLCDIVEREIDALCGFIVRESQYNADAVVQWLVKCVCGMPLKTMHYGILTAILNVRNPALGQAVFVAMQQTLQQALSDRNFLHSKLLIRYFCELVNCGSVDVMDMARILHQLADEITHQTAPRIRKEYFALLVLTMMPWAGPMLRQHNSSRTHLDQLMHTLETYMTNRKNISPTSTTTTTTTTGTTTTTSHRDRERDNRDRDSRDSRDSQELSMPLDVLERYPFRSISKELPSDAGDLVGMWYRRVRSAYQRDFRITSELHLVASSLSGDYQSMLATAKRFPLPPIEIPVHVDGTGYPTAMSFPLPLFVSNAPASFTNSTQPTSNSTTSTPKPVVPDYEGLNELIVLDYIDDLLVAFGDNPKNCATQLVTMFCRSPQLIVQALFCRILELPTCRSHVMFYAGVLLEVCWFLGKELQHLLGKAINQLWQWRCEMDEESGDRFVEWFVIHISNTDFKWPWKIWAPAANLESHHVSRTTTHDMLSRLVRLSYLNRIKASLPEAILPLLPPEAHPQYDFGVSEATSEASGTIVEVSPAATQMAKKLLDMFKEKSTPEQMIEFVTASVLSVVEPLDGSTNATDGRDPSSSVSNEAGNATDETSGDHVMDDDDVDERRARWQESSRNQTGTTEEMKLKREIFAQTLLFYGSRSYSHVVNLIEKYLEVLQQLFENTNDRVELLKAVNHVWEHHDQMVVIIIEKLLMCRIVDPNAIVDWIFAPYNTQSLHKLWIWEVLFKTIDRTLLRSFSLQTEVDVLMKQTPNILISQHSAVAPATATPAATPTNDGEGSNGTTATTIAATTSTTATGTAHQQAITPAPLSAELKHKKAQLDLCLREQKEMFLVIFQRFTVALSDHLAAHPSPSRDQVRWFELVCGRLLQAGRKYHTQIAVLVPFLESYLFVPSKLDAQIVNVFRKIQRVVAFYAKPQITPSK